MSNEGLWKSQETQFDVVDGQPRNFRQTNGVSEDLDSLRKDKLEALQRL